MATILNFGGWSGLSWIDLRLSEGFRSEFELFARVRRNLKGQGPV